MVTLKITYYLWFRAYLLIRAFGKIRVVKKLAKDSMPQEAKRYCVRVATSRVHVDWRVCMPIGITSWLAAGL